jgi:hypothetical protein
MSWWEPKDITNLTSAIAAANTAHQKIREVEVVCLSRSWRSRIQRVGSNVAARRSARKAGSYPRLQPDHGGSGAGAVVPYGLAISTLRGRDVEVRK